MVTIEAATTKCEALSCSEVSEVWHRCVQSWLQPRIPEHVDWNHICTSAQGEFDEPVQTLRMTKRPHKMALDIGKQPGSVLQVDGLLLGAGGKELDNSTHVKNDHSLQGCVGHRNRRDKRWFMKDCSRMR